MIARGLRAARVVWPLVLVLGASGTARAQVPRTSPPARPGAPAPAVTPAPAVSPGRVPAATGAPRVRLAITELSLDGEGATPALAMQLQDGFVLALVRAGFEVLDAVDVGKRLTGAPELQDCETSPCLKRTGELLAVPFVIRVRVTNTGNSYRMTARLFSTQGAAPAALPVAAQSRACDVCTVAEAREYMIRLADGLRPRIEEHIAPPPPPPAPPPAPRLRVAPLAAFAAGLVAVVGGALLARSAGQGDKPQTALGGALMGAGLAASVVGLYAGFSPGPASEASDVRASQRFQVAARVRF